MYQYQRSTLYFPFYESHTYVIAHSAVETKDCPDPNSTSQSTHFNNNTQRLLIKISQQREFETSGLGWSYEKLQINCCPDPNSNSTSHSTNFTLPPTSKELYNGATAQQLLLHKGGIHYTDHNRIDVMSILSHHHRFHTKIQEQHNLPPDNVWHELC